MTQAELRRLLDRRRALRREPREKLRPDEARLLAELEYRIAAARRELRVSEAAPVAIRAWIEE